MTLVWTLGGKISNYPDSIKRRHHTSSMHDVWPVVLSHAWMLSRWVKLSRRSMEFLSLMMLRSSGPESEALDSSLVLVHKQIVKRQHFLNSCPLTLKLQLVAHSYRHDTSIFNWSWLSKTINVPCVPKTSTFLFFE